MHIPFRWIQLSFPSSAPKYLILHVSTFIFLSNPIKYLFVASYYDLFRMDQQTAKKPLQSDKEFTFPFQQLRSFNDKEPPNWAALCFSRCGNLPETPEGCRSAKFMTTTHTTSPPLYRMAILGQTTFHKCWSPLLSVYILS